MHDDVDAAETIVHGLGDRGAAFRGGHVRLDELIRMRKIVGPRARNGQDCRSCFAQGRHDRFAHALGATRNERTLHQ